MKVNVFVILLFILFGKKVFIKYMSYERGYRVSCFFSFSFIIDFFFVKFWWIKV